MGNHKISQQAWCLHEIVFCILYTLTHTHIYNIFSPTLSSICALSSRTQFVQYPNSCDSVYSVQKHFATSIQLHFEWQTNDEGSFIKIRICHYFHKPHIGTVSILYIKLQKEYLFYHQKTTNANRMAVWHMETTLLVLFGLFFGCLHWSF